MNRQTDFQQRFLELRTILEARQYDKLSASFLPVPNEFNWVRDVFEPIILPANAQRMMLELVTDDKASPVTLTYRQGFDKSNQFVNLLRKQGLQQGERIFAMCGLDEGVWITYLAAITGGYVLIPAASILSIDDLVYRFQKAAPKVIIADLENAEKVEKALLRHPHPVAIKLLLDGQREGWVSFEAIATEDTVAMAANTHRDEALFWFFTSGTTGLPKVAIHTHASYPLGHLSTAVWIGLRAGDRHYNIAQPGWAKFAWSSFFAPLNVGATIFSYKSKGRFIGSDQLRLIQDHRITTLCAPPTALRLLIQEKLNSYRFSLRECVSAGEPLNAEIIKTWHEGTGLQLRDGYGQTETTCLISNLPDSQVKFGSMGKPTFLYDILIVDEDGHELPLLETGQIAVRLHEDQFRGVFKTYLDDAEREKEVFEHGLYYTGDKAYKDQEGYYWFVGRDDDVIKSSAYRIGPFEIESVLLEVDEVLESAVVGSPHPLRGKEIKAFVVLVSGVAPSRFLADKLVAHCKTHLAHYKVPRLIEFVTELPKTISGKIRRVELRAAEEQRKIRNEKGPHEYSTG